MRNAFLLLLIMMFVVLIVIRVCKILFEFLLKFYNRTLFVNIIVCVYLISYVCVYVMSEVEYTTK